jgi:hypothetical protein
MKCSEALTKRSEYMTQLVAAFEEAYTILEKAATNGSPKVRLRHGILLLSRVSLHVASMVLAQ